VILDTGLRRCDEAFFNRLLATRSRITCCPSQDCGATSVLSPAGDMKKTRYFSRIPGKSAIASLEGDVPRRAANARARINHLY
jgi:hypothetical protein